MSTEQNSDHFKRERPLRLLAFFAVLLGLNIALSYSFYRSLGGDSPGFLKGQLTVLFFLLNSLLLLGGLHAILGFIHWVFKRGQGRSRLEGELKSRHVIVMPIYQEDPASVGARLEAIYRSVRSTGHLESFDFYFLSDSTSDEQWLREEAMWREICQINDASGRLFYRRRRKNVNRKSGNIADFVETYGGDYETMLVLDADSLMDGQDIVQMALEMEAAPELGILQSPPRFVRSDTPFAMAQQFALQLFGPLSLRGLAWWQGDRGSYWGHNAFIRITPFAECCELPDLPGREPFGGKILSHDFVEAALMVRAGWKVRLAWDVTGSYEEFPPSLYDFLIRDRRWCQGNLQHIWVLFARGFPISVRLHLVIGIFSYLAGPLWFLFLLTAAVLTAAGGTIGPELLVYVLTVLFLPKVLGLIRLLFVKPERQGFGGMALAVANTLLETALSTLVAPIVMVGHTLIVLDLLRGRVVGWNVQNRGGDGTSWGQAWTAHWMAAALGVAFLAISLEIGGTFLLWMSPIILGLLGSVVLSVILSRPSWGNKWRSLGVFRNPTQRDTPKVVAMANEAESRLRRTLNGHFAKHGDAILAVLVDPTLNITHRRRFENGVAYPQDSLSKLLTEGFSAITREELQDILYNRDALRELHLRLWKKEEIHSDFQTALTRYDRRAA